MSSSAAAAMEVPAMITTPLIAVSVIFPVLSLSAFLLRIQARNIAQQPFLADDYVMCLAWFFTLGSSILIWVFAALGGIDHYKINPMIGTEHSLQCLLISAAYLQAPLGSVKVSILLFYKRIFNTSKFAIAAWIAIVMVICWSIIFFCLVLLQGVPISAAWTGVGYLRFNTVALGLAQVGSSIGLDVLILCFPLPIIFSLHMRATRKIAIASIFWLGILCCAAAGARFYLCDLATTQVVQSAGYDMIYTQSKNVIFMIIEPNLSIVAGCLPCYGPLLRSGRTTESIIRSIRGILSLRSGRGSSGPPSRTGRGSDQASLDKAGSNVELRQQASREWLAANGGYQDPENVFPGKSINVTHAVDIVRN